MLSLRSCNDGGGSLRRCNRPLDFSEADAIAVALTPAAHDKRIAVFQEGTRDGRRELDRLGAVPADLQRLPRWSFSGPLIVPLPRRSPTFIAQPLEAWCTSCCTEDQYMYLKLVRQMRFASFIAPARKATSSCKS